MDIAELAIRVKTLEARTAKKDLDNLSSSGSQAEKIFKSLTATVAALGLAKIAKDAIATYSEFEQMSKSLKTMTGSTELAAQAMKNLESFAATTPFSLQQATQGYIKLKALGLDPSRDAMTSFGNTAAAMGKDLNQMIEAVADAATGEFERLKEFGIKSKTVGDDVSFTFQGVTTTVGKNSKEITAYLKSIGDVNFAGAMTDQMDTVKGALSNMTDNFAKFQVELLKQTGAGDAYKNLLQSLASVIGSLTSNMDTLIAVAKAAGIALQALALVMTARMIPALIATIGRFAVVAVSLTTYYLQAGIATAATNLLSSSMALLGGPIGVAVLAISAFAIWVGRTTNESEKLRTSIQLSNGTYVTHANVVEQARILAAQYTNATKEKRAQIKGEIQDLIVNTKAHIENSKALLEATYARSQNAGILEKGIAFFTSGDFDAFDGGWTKVLQRQSSEVTKSLVSLSKLETQYKNLGKTIPNVSAVTGGNVKSLKELASTTGKTAKSKQSLIDKLTSERNKLTLSGVEALKLSAEYKNLSSADKLRAVALQGSIDKYKIDSKTVKDNTKVVEDNNKTREEGLKALKLSRKELEVYSKTGKEATKIIDGLTKAESEEVAVNKEKLSILKKVTDGIKDQKLRIAALLLAVAGHTNAVALNTYELEGYTKQQGLAKIADDKREKSLEALLQKQEAGRERIKELEHATTVHTIAVKQGTIAAEIYAKTVEFGSEALARQAIEAGKLASSTGALAGFWADAKDAMNDFILSGMKDFESLKDSIVDTFKDVVLRPRIEAVTDQLEAVLKGGGSTGGILGSIGGIYKNGGGISGAFQSYGTGAAISQLFGGGEGSQIGGGVGSLIGSAFGPLGSAIGNALGGLVGSVFDNKKTVTADFRSNTDRYNAYGGSDGSGIGRNTTGQAFYRESVFGSYGLRARGKGGDTVALNRDEQGQIEAVMTMLDSMTAIDAMIGDFVSETDIANVKSSLDDFKGNALKPAELVTERLGVIFSAIPSELSKLVDLDQPIEAVVARIAEVSQAATVTVPALKDLGFNLGDVQNKAIVSALGLTDLSGGLQGFIGQFENYISTIYTEEEQLQVKQAAAANALLDLNNQLGLTGDSVIDTRDELKAYVNELNASGSLQTVAGQEAFNAAISSANAVATIADSGMSLSEVIAGLDQDLLGVAVAISPLEESTNILADTGKAAVAVIDSLSVSLGTLGGIKAPTDGSNEEINTAFVDLNESNDETNEKIASLEKRIEEQTIVTKSLESILGNILVANEATSGFMEILSKNSDRTVNV